MYTVINHRVNTLEKLSQTPKECGVEVDIRPYKDKLILNHDPYSNGIEFSEFLENFDGISDDDRKILSENFTSLPEKDLREELTNLYEIFNGG